MISFHKLLEKMMESDQYDDDSQDSNALLKSGVESKAMDMIRSGKDLEGSFWQNFINMCSNSESMSDLLDVPKHKIAEWPSKIQELLDEVENLDSEDVKEKKKVVSTGDNTSLADPSGPDGSQLDQSAPNNVTGEKNEFKFNT